MAEWAGTGLDGPDSDSAGMVSPKSEKQPGVSARPLGAVSSSELLTPNSSHWSCPSREAISHVAEITPVPMPFLYHLLPHGSQELLRSYEELDSCSTVRPFIFRQVIPDQCKHQLSCADAAGGGLLDGLHGVAVVQDIAKIQVFPFFQQVVVGGNLSLPLAPDIQQGLIPLDLELPLRPGLGQLRRQVQQDPEKKEIINGVNASDPELCFQATQATRILLEERNPPLKLMVEAGFILRLVGFLRSSRHACLQFEAAWALTNITPWPSELTAVMEEGAIQTLVELLSSLHVTVCEQAVWALGNRAGDGPEFKDFVISSNAIPHLLALISSTIPVNVSVIFLNITWTLSNLCQSKNPYPCKKAVKQMLLILSHLLQHQDSGVLSDACCALSYLTEVCNEHIGQVVDVLVLPTLAEHMTSCELKILTPSLHTVGNILTATDHQIHVAIDGGTLGVLAQLLLHHKFSIQKVAAWALSNVATGSPQHLPLIVCSILPPLEDLLKKEAAWMVANFATGGTMNQLIQLIHSGVLEPLVNLLTTQDTKFVIIIFDILFLLFQAKEKLSKKEFLCHLIKECEGLHRIRALQFHKNHQVALIAQKTIENNFSEEEVNGIISPSLNQDHKFLKHFT
ncbi:LOW QUALITY PROTEIN: importin subunit alpha-8-like [Glossophaga mutica]